MAGGGGGGGGGGRPAEKAAGAGAGRGQTAIQSTIQSIKEVVGGHSDADIYATLRECNMDPNETTQKLLNQDPFHEVKRKRDKKRESAVQKTAADASPQVDHSSQWMKPRTQRVENDRRRAYSHGQASGPSREFRVVRDNRHGVVENRPDLGYKGSPNVKVSDRSAPVVQSGRNHPPATTLEGQIAQGARYGYNSDMHQVKRQAQGTAQKYVKPHLKNSQDDQHLPTSDPAHTRANFKAAEGAVGSIRCHGGLASAARQASARSSSHLHVSSGGPHVNNQRGNFVPGGPFGRHFTSKNMQSIHRTALDSVHRGRSFVAPSISKYQQGPASNQKAAQPAKEWKPKPTKKSSSTTTDNSGTYVITPSASNTENSNVLDENALCDKISEAIIHEVEHVIIPEHLRVPEYEQTGLRFGSFPPGPGADQVPSSESPSESEEQEHVQEPAQLVEEDSLHAGHDEVDEQARSSQLNLSTSTAEISLPPSEDSIELNGEEVENDDGLGLVESNTPLGAVDGQNMQCAANLTAFSTYGHEDPNMHPNNEAQLYRLVEPNVHPQVMASHSQVNLPGYPTEIPEADNAVQVFRIPESNVHSQVLPSTSEALSSQIVSSSPVGISQQLQHMSQPQQAAQLYPPVHMQHYPNFMPYRHIYSPVYVPPMAMPNFPTNMPYPSNGNSYLQMPGGGSHLAAGGMKYGVSQYKPVPAGSPSGYGSYTHPGFPMNPPGVIGGGAVGVDDVNRIKYKDNNSLYASPQVETADIWIQPPREMPTLQCPPYFNLSGQPTSGAFVPNPGNASFNATAQSSHAPFPGLYHPQQPSSIVSPHPMVHQQVPSAIGPSVGVGVATPAPQVGAYQQPQLGHWRPGF